MLTERTKIKFKIPSRRRFVDDFVVKNRQVLAARIRSMKNVWGGEGELNCITSVGVIGKCRCLLRREIRNSIDSITREHAILRSTFETVSIHMQTYTCQSANPRYSLACEIRCYFTVRHYSSFYGAKFYFDYSLLFYTRIFYSYRFLEDTRKIEEENRIFLFFFLNLNNKEFNFLS